MREGNLIDAKEKLVYCGSPQCPEVMHVDCQRWLLEVETSMPTVVFRVETSDGRISESARVSIDGRSSVLLDGRAISVNPGKHHVAFLAQGRVKTSKVFIFSEGEKLRREVVVFPPVLETEREQNVAQDESVATDAQRSDSRFTLPIVLASAAAVVGGVGAAYFGMTARAEDRDLGACSPNCSQDSVDRVKRDYLMANTSLGLTAVGLASAVAFVVFEFRSTSSRRSAHLGVGTHPSALGLSVIGNY